MEWKEFRALEYFAILYDIAIDAEQNNPDWCSISLAGKDDDYFWEVDGIEKERNKPWSLKRVLVLPTDDLRPSNLDPNKLVSVPVDFTSTSETARRFLLPMEWSTPVELGQDHPTALCPSGSEEVSENWRKLLIAKKIRAVLQKKGTTAASEALDQLGLALTRVMPAPKAHFDLSEGKEVQLFLLKVLFLNEISQCYKDARSIAFSDDCLDLIKTQVQRLGLANDTLGAKGRIPYELIAIYNKAQGYLHLKDHEKALDEFEKVTYELCQEEGKKRSNSYFSVPDGSHFTWRTTDRLLWETISRWPAILQKADVLVNLQRSEEAGDVLSGVDDGALNGYQKRRKKILLDRIALDTADPRDTSPLNLSCLDLACDEKNLESQRLSVETQYRQVCISRTLLEMEQGVKDGDSDERKREKEEKLKELAIHLDKTCSAITQRLRLAHDERSETDQTVSDWVKGLAICADIFHKLKHLNNVKQDNSDLEGLFKAVRAYALLDTPEEWGPMIRVSCVAQDLAIDDHYRDYQFETRKALVHNGWKLYKALKDFSDDKEYYKDLVNELNQSNLDLLKKLDNEKLHPSPGYEKHWREQLKILYEGETLPVVGDGVSISWDPQTEFRRVLSHSLVGCREKECQQNAQKMYQCFEEESSSGSSSMRLICDQAKKAISKQVAFSMDEGDEVNTWHHYLDRIQGLNEEVLEERLHSSSDHSTPSGWGFAVLQRWNSYTPALTASEGGGYFLFRQDIGRKQIETGLVIDPGYGFLKNFFGERFGICDISAMAVTHNHPDHLADFQAIVNLLIEAQRDRVGTKGKKRVSRKVMALLSSGAFEHLLPVIEGAREVFKDSRKLKEDTNVELADGLKVHGCRAIHKDASDRADRPGYDSLGLILQRESDFHIGLPSDTKWENTVIDQYIGRRGTRASRGLCSNPGWPSLDSQIDMPPCDVVCAHVGSIIRSASKMPIPECFSTRLSSYKVLQDGWHLYFPGAVWLLKQLADALKQAGRTEPVLVVLSEFGEEMRGGLRLILTRVLQEFVGLDGTIVVIPGDIGLLIDPIKKLLQCSCCKQFYPWITWMKAGDKDCDGVYEVFGDVEQVFYVCPSCKTALSSHQRAAIFTDHQAPLYRRLTLDVR